MINRYQVHHVLWHHSWSCDEHLFDVQNGGRVWDVAKNIDETLLSNSKRHEYVVSIDSVSPAYMISFNVPNSQIR